MATPSGKSKIIIQLEACIAPAHAVAGLMSTETIRTIRDGEPRTVTSTFTQFLSSALAAKLSSPNVQVMHWFIDLLTD